MFCLLYNASSSISFSADLGGLRLFKIQNSLHEYFSPSIIPVSGWSLLSSLCTTLKASRNSVKSILPSLLKSILRARSSMALLSMSTPRWALKRRQVWRNSSIEIRPENDTQKYTPPLLNCKEYISRLLRHSLFTWMVFVYNVEYYLNVCPVSEQGFCQVLSDLKGEKEKYGQ